MSTTQWPSNFEGKLHKKISMNFEQNGSCDQKKLLFFTPQFI